MARAIKSSTVIVNILVKQFDCTKGEADQIRRAIAKTVKTDDESVTITWHRDGFVPNSYKWPAPGTRVVAEINPFGVVVYNEPYDRKRPHGRGNAFTVRALRAGQTRGRVLDI